MGSPTIGTTTHQDADHTPHEGGRLVTERDGGQAGVSDERRAELGRMEAAAGVESEGQQETERPRPGAPDHAASGLHQASISGHTAPDASASQAVNPDLDKQ